MILEILAKVDGTFKIEIDLRVEKYPYTINIVYSEEKQEYFLSIRKRMVDFLEHLPKANMNPNGKLVVEFPPHDFFEDIILIMQHIEAFGAIDKNITKIHWENPIIKWIPENEYEHLSIFSEYEREREYSQSHKVITKNWLSETIFFKEQMGNLYIPFSFFREGVNQYHQYRYQGAFCTFYMMLEYFFYDESRKYGIRNDAYKKYLVLNTALCQTLEYVEHSRIHYNWLNQELKKRNKNNNVEGLLFILNRFRDELSHATSNDSCRNPFKEENYSSLAFIAMSVCLHVSIKMRLLPFVQEENKESFLNTTPKKK